MKKALLIILLCGVILLSGCGDKEQKLNCTLTKNDVVNGYKMTSHYDVTSKNKIVTKVITTETVESEDTEVLDYFKSYIEEAYTKMNEAYGGYDFKTTLEDKKLVVNTTIDYTILNLEQLSKDDSSMKQFVDEDNNLTLDGIKKMYEILGASCKE